MLGSGITPIGPGGFGDINFEHLNWLATNVDPVPVIQAVDQSLAQQAQMGDPAMTEQGLWGGIINGPAIGPKPGFTGMAPLPPAVMAQMQQKPPQAPQAPGAAPQAPPQLNIQSPNIGRGMKPVPRLEQLLGR